MKPMPQFASSRHHYTYAEHLAYERDSRLEHEYDNGEILAMTGGSRRHNALASRISAALEKYVLVSRSDARIERYRRLASGSWEYSDVTAGQLALQSGGVIDLTSLYTGLPD